MRFLPSRLGCTLDNHASIVAAAISYTRKTAFKVSQYLERMSETNWSEVIVKMSALAYNVVNLEAQYRLCSILVVDTYPSVKKLYAPPQEQSDLVLFVDTI